MNRQYGRTLQDTVTTLPAADVLAAAKRFFSGRGGIYVAFVEKEGPTYVNLRGQGGEELVIGVTADPRGTRVTGSTYLFDMQVAQFLGSLPAAPDAAPVPAAPVDALPADAQGVATSDAAPPGGASIAPPPPAPTAGGARPGGSPA
jgi:hypothetical protein